MEGAAPSAAKTGEASQVLTRSQLDDLYRLVNGKFRDSAELRLEAGREMLKQLFADDADLALGPGAQTHPPWVEFRKLAGGRKVKPTVGALRRALRLAAFEKTVTGGFYANLDISLREELLPISDHDEIRAAAQLCIENHWGQRALRRHVRLMLAAAVEGTAALPADVARAAIGPLDRFADAHASPASQRAFEKAVSRLSEQERARAREKIERAWTVLRALRKLIK